MKPYKIKRRERRQPVYIIGPSVSSFKQPKIPLYFLTNIHKIKKNIKIEEPVFQDLEVVSEIA